jgi:hypothetical protein
MAATVVRSATRSGSLENTDDSDADVVVTDRLLVWLSLASHRVVSRLFMCFSLPGKHYR